MSVTVMPFGRTKRGEVVHSYTLSNRNGMRVTLLDYGCVIQSVVVPDKDGIQTDVVLGYDTFEAYEEDTGFFGVFLGRYANRISGSTFEINGTTYSLTPNEGINHLHGVYRSCMYEAETQENAVIFRRTSPDGEEGYPGTVALEITCQLTEENEMLLIYDAKTDADTVINLTHHTYFNLEGHDSGSTAEQWLMLNASAITEIQPDTIPTGAFYAVEGTPFDFRQAKPIGRDRDKSNVQLRMTNGYDHNYVLDTDGRNDTAALVWSERTGIRMECRTTQPGIQFYNANFLTDDVTRGKGKQGVTYKKYGAFCLETQHFPDSPNRPEFPSTILRKGEQYHEIAGFRFTVTGQG